MEAFFTRDLRKKQPPEKIEKIARLLDRLDASRMPQDMNLPGLGFHALKGNQKGRFAVSVSGNWRLTFRFDGEDAVEVDLEDYH